MGFQGSVESFSLADVFQNLAMNQQSGTLCLFQPDSPTCHIFFENGQVKYLSHGSQRPLLFGEMLIGRGIATQEQVQKALNKQKETGEPLGQCLVSLASIDGVHLDNLVKHQIEEDIYELFGWEKAQFEFTDGPATPELFKDQIAAGGAIIPIAYLIMEAARRVDEWDKLRQQIPSFKEIYVLNEMVRGAIESGQLEIDSLEKRILSLIDGTRDVEDLIEDSFLFRFEVLQSIAALLQASMIRPATMEELADATGRLEKSNNRARLCKVLERQLGAGDDRPELRRRLADALAEEGHNDKAAIHFSVLAEAELENGHQEECIALLRRILSILPNHLHSRSQLGAIYIKRQQRVEAMVQYRELINAYRNNKQWPEARDASLKALKCDPNHLEIRHELIEIYLEEGDKLNAAKQYEIKGDQLARKGQSRPSAEAYRRAMQIAPSLTHLKSKLANVLLTQEDIRARNKRNVIVASVVAAILLVGGLDFFHEFKNNEILKQTQGTTEMIIQEAERAYQAGQYLDARDRYKEAIEQYNISGLRQAWAPILGCKEEAEAEVKRIQGLQDASQEMHISKVNKDIETIQKWSEDAKKLQGSNSIFEALNLLKQVRDHKYVPSDLKADTVKQIALLETKEKEIYEAIARLQKPPEEAFSSIEEEYTFKNKILDRYGHIQKIKETKILLPFEVLSDLNGITVKLDGVTAGTTSRSGRNTFRYDPDRSLVFEFECKGYKTVTEKVEGLGPSMNISMEREPTQFQDLNTALSGNGLYDGEFIWVGTASGGLLQLHASTLTNNWQFRLPGGGGLNEVSGDIYLIKTRDQKKMLVYGTKGGSFVGVYPGQESPAWHLQLNPGQVSRCAPALITLTHAQNRQFLAVAVDQSVMILDTETGTKLGWGTDRFKTPMAITTPPITIENNKVIVMGCADGNLYGLDSTTGKRLRTWTTGGPSIRGTPVATDKHLVASSDDGKIYFFELSGGHTINPMAINGQMTAPPVIKDQLLYVGTSVNDGLFVINLDRQALEIGFSGKHIQGGVNTSPTFKKNRMYFGTREGWLYAKELDKGRYVDIWKYQAKGIGGLASSPLIVEDRIVFITADGRIFAFAE